MGKVISWVCDHCDCTVPADAKLYLFEIGLFDRDVEEIKMPDDDFTDCVLCEDCVKEVRAWLFNEELKEQPAPAPEISASEKEEFNKVTEEMIDNLEDNVEAVAVEVVKREKKKTGPKKNIDYGKIWALKNAGWSQKKIADEMGCSEASICRILKKA